MFKKILIANRGEIACRVIKTARKMGIRTVAVTRMPMPGRACRDGDEEVAYLARPGRLSYLMIEKIVEACLKTGAEAVHPATAFSPNVPPSPRPCRGGHNFIGPNGRHRRHGRQDRVEEGGGGGQGLDVPATWASLRCGGGGEDRLRDRLPVMIKASAGGGGKGMRNAYSEAEVQEGFTPRQVGAKSSFGDDRVSSREFIVNPRHIEIQVLGDKHGNVIYLESANARSSAATRRS